MNTVQELIQQGNDAILKNDVLRAEALFQQAVSLDPKSANARVELARILVALGKIAVANEQLDAALAMEPTHALGLSIKGAVKVIEEKYSEAVHILSEAIQLDSKLGIAYANLGIAQRELGLLKDSENNIRAAIAINSQDYEAFYALGETLCAAERMEEGILAVLESIKINPGFVKGYIALAELYELGGRPDLAEELYDECLKRVPEAVIVREKLIELYFSHQKFEAAQGEMELIAQQRGHITDWLKLGNLSIVARKFKVAELAFQKAVELAPNSWEPHYNLGDLYDAANLTDAAGKEYELAIKLNPGSFKPHNGIGLWLLKQDRLPESIEHLRKAHQLMPSAPEAAYNLALALVKSDQKDEAKLLLNEIVSNLTSDRITEDAKRLMNAL